jgi:hypothetical protein
MATANLEDTLVSDGHRLLTQLSADGVRITVAFWAQVGDDRQWLLYIACDLVDSSGLAIAYRRVSHAFEQVDRRGRPSFKLSDVKLIGAESDIATAAVHFRDRFKQHGAHQVMVHSAWQVFGPLAMQDVWVYGEN